MAYNFKHLNEGKWEEFSSKTLEMKVKIKDIMRELEIANEDSNEELLSEIEDVMVDVEDYIKDKIIFLDGDSLCKYEINIPKDKYQIALDLINKLSEHIGYVGSAYIVNISGSYMNDINSYDIINNYKDVESSLRKNSIHSILDYIEVNITFNKIN